MFVENLEGRRLFSDVSGLANDASITPDEPLAIYDSGYPIDPDAPQSIQVRNRWSSTASGSTGTTGQGITLTWSVVPDGTALGSGNGEPAAGSDLRARLDAIYGSQVTWLPVIQSVFDSWSAISGITYIYETNDDGAAYSSFANGSLGVRGDVRIGAHPIDGAYNVLAYNWFPSYGEMVIDSNDLVSGGFMFNTNSNSLRLRNVLAHEHGHGLGFNHVDPLDETKLMEAYASTKFDGPQFDDMLAVNRNYGDFFEKTGGNNSIASATNRGTLSDTIDSLTNLSLATTSDVDYFKFTLGSTKDASISINPFGPAYNQGPQGGTTSSFNASAQMNLKLDIYASNGSTLLGSSDSGAVGFGESISLSGLAAGMYYIKVSPGASATNSAQMYTLSTNIASPITTTTSIALANNTLTLSDTSHKTDTLTVTADTANSRLIFSDPANFLSSSVAGSTGSGTHTVYVTFASISGATTLALNLFGGADSLTIDSTYLPVTIDAGSGTDTLNVIETAASAPVTLLPSTGLDSIYLNTDNTGSASLLFGGGAPQQVGALTLGNGASAALSGSSLSTTSLSFSSSATLDIGSSALVIDYANNQSSPLASIQNYIRTGRGTTGFGTATWTGAGINSSTAALSDGVSFAIGFAENAFLPTLGLPSYTTFAGQTVDSSSVLVRYTRGGDANLDGTVNTDDVTVVGAVFDSASTGAWYLGDFDYDGNVDSDDVTVLGALYSPANTLLFA